MKRERVKIKTASSTRTPRGFRYKVRPTEAERLERAKTRAANQMRRRLDRNRIEATTKADSYVVRLMREITFARNAAKAAKEIEAEAWARLSRYLTDGTRDDGKKPRIRIVDPDDIPAER